ncbi:ERAD-associated E3 ubiquitin-protein ligase component HRD3A [Trichoplax sp. H2]|nr:ERAD-associated E3 ubiquitin-protein ligase component HRD3A [Trichoplax sp. H2]|eukprot:RDD44215.1 ERAD-associated E3 ubiquitin-protein ligase component HRD3A [Trichoplax sp. H2]
MEELRKTILHYGKKKDINQLLKHLTREKINNELYDQMIQLYKERIQASNDAHSHFELGYIYQFGLGRVSKDFNQAFIHYSQAAKLNHPSAQYHICQLCCSRDEANHGQYACVMDKRELIELRVRMYITSAAQGEAYSDADRCLWSNYSKLPEWRQQIHSYYSALCRQSDLILHQRASSYYDDNQYDFEKVDCSPQQYYGRIYNQLGYLTFKFNYYNKKNDDEYTRAREYFEKAGDHEEPSGYFNLSRWIYNVKQGIQQDRILHKRYLLLAAKNGHALAQHDVVTLCDDSDINDIINRFEMLQKSFRYSFARTCYDLAVAYLCGYSVERDYDIAISYLNRAIVSRDFRMGDGLAKASIALALIYKNGIGCHVNMVKACHYLAYATQHYEEPLFYCQIGKLIKKITHRKDIAAKLYKQAMPCPYAYYLMGKLYHKESKKRLFQINKTNKYFQLALDNHSVYVLQHYHLGIIYQFGLGTETNRRRADRHFKNQIQSASESLDYYMVYLGQKADEHYGVRSLVMVVPAPDVNEVTVTESYEDKKEEVNTDELML